MKLQDYLSPSLLGSILFPLQPRGMPGRQREPHLPISCLWRSNNPISLPLSYAHLSVNSFRRIKERKSDLLGLLFSSDFWASVFKYPPSNLCREAGCAVSEWGEGKDHGSSLAPVRTPSPLRFARRGTKQMRGREGRGAAQTDPGFCKCRVGSRGLVAGLKIPGNGSFLFFWNDGNYYSEL